jgi:hypothetical protein
MFSQYSFAITNKYSYATPWRVRDEHLVRKRGPGIYVANDDVQRLGTETGVLMLTRRLYLITHAVQWQGRRCFGS